MGHQAAGDRAAPADRSARLQADRDAAQQPDRLRRRLFRGRHRLCADLAHLVDGGARASPAPSRPSSSSPGATIPNTRCRRTSSPRSTAVGARRASRWWRAASPASRRSSIRPPGERDPHHVGARAEPDGGHKGPAPKRIVTGYGFWIFLLSDFIMFSGFYAAYAVLSHGDRRRPFGRRAVRSAHGRGRDRLPVAVELRLRHGHDRQQRAQHAAGPSVCYLVTGLLGLAFLVLEVSEFAKMLARGRGPAAQRISVGLFRAGRLPRPARHDRPALARHDDGAVLGQGIPRLTSCAAACASGCSGTRSTSSGSAFSPTSIFWGRSHERTRRFETSTSRARAKTPRSTAQPPASAIISSGSCSPPVLTIGSFWVGAATTA